MIGVIDVQFEGIVVRIGGNGTLIGVIDAQFEGIVVRIGGIGTLRVVIAARIEGIDAWLVGIGSPIGEIGVLIGALIEALRVQFAVSNSWF